MKKITIIGYLGDNPEVKQLENKRFQVKFNVGVTERKKEEDKEPNTEWFFVYKSYQNEPKELLKYLKKGVRVCCFGDISFNQSMSKGAIYFNKYIFCQDLELLLDSKPKKK